MTGQLWRNIWLIALMLISTAAVLYRLDAMPMYLWDESRQANNALEMAETNNLAYTTYDGQPDFWNTKPHLLVILQYMFFKALGPGTLALRLPSALAAIVCLWVWQLFLLRRKGLLAATVFTCVLLCCRGFNVYHIARTGDYDALLTLCISICVMYLYRFAEEGNQPVHFRNGMIWFAMGFLAKGVAMLLWGPPLVFLLLFRQPAPWNLFRTVWKYILIPVAVILFYYTAHEVLTPGYLSAVWDNEIHGRYLQQNEGHETPWWYYLSEIYTAYFPWFWTGLFLGALHLVYGFKKNEWSRPYLRMGGTVLVFITVLSLSQTRIHWYLAPAIPLFAFLLAWYAHVVVYARAIPLGREGIILLTLISVAAWFNAKELREANRYLSSVSQEWVFMQVDKGKMAFPYQGKWLTAGYAPLEKFYSRKFHKMAIPFIVQSNFEFQTGDTVFVSHMEHLDSLGKRYFVRQLHAPQPSLPVWVVGIEPKWETSQGPKKIPTF
ncbi:MAG: glycosyltransferase family 39 protein [Bacteroidetes bacterium]|nr:glycosyltransferase family 39 protein [Bacteroidota bacterium]